jgi:hypothetical protein
VTLDTLLIGDAERGQVVDELKRHCGDGRLTLDEYSERLDEVFAARTSADLARSLRDLPGPLAVAAGGAPRRGPDPRYLHHVPRYLKVMGVLLIVWALSGHGSFWPAWPLLVLGICLVRRVHRFGPRHYGELPPAPSGRERVVRV